MSTPHNAAAAGDFAKTVLMPGDPLRAKFIAETFLESPGLVTSVRGMLGYTGTYKGVPVSVMGSGMGMSSIGIYSWELFTQYGVENIIRIGAGTDGRNRFVANGYEKDVTYPSEALCGALRKSAARLGMPLIEGAVHSSDVFYRDAEPDYWEKLRDEKGCLAVEMESFALFHNAAATKKNAACLLTISDSFVSHEETTAEQRQTSFTNMMEIALGSVLE